MTSEPATPEFQPAADHDAAMIHHVDAVAPRGGQIQVVQRGDGRQFER